MTDCLNIVCRIQLRTLHHEHSDQYWVNAITRYYKDWIVDIKLVVESDMVKFVGQDNKAKIPVGDIVPVSSNVHIKNKTIVSVNNNNNMNKTIDHDWSKTNIILSVTLLGNISNDYYGSFYSGGENSDGEIYVTLRDTIFNGSDIFGHFAQLYQIINNKNIQSFIILLQTDSGPDHNLNFFK